MEKFNYTFVEDEVKHEDIVTVINDYYNSRDICEYMIPIPESSPLNYSVVKEEILNNKEYYDINYKL